MAADAFLVAGEIVEKLDKAYNSGDAKAYAACFAEDADFINRFGMHLEGNRAIEERHRELFSRIARGATGVLRLVKARSLSEDVVYAKADGEWQTPPGNPMAGTTLSRYSIIIVRRGDVWRVAAMQNTGPSDSP
jgi:uncharacterized protein (TIGR02246 family)